MKAFTPRVVLLASLALAPFGCGGGSSDAGGGFDGPPSATVTSDQGSFRIEVRTSPSPPLRGTNEVELHVVRAADGTPANGLGLTVVPWMPVMGHGASVTPTITPHDDGRYVVGNVSTFMPGRWELRTTIPGSPEDHAAPPIDVP